MTNNKSGTYAVYGKNEKGIRVFLGDKKADLTTPVADTTSQEDNVTSSQAVGSRAKKSAKGKATKSAK